jgi:hypothetical protein
MPSVAALALFALATLSLASALARGAATAVVTLAVNASDAFDVSPALVSVCLSVFAPYTPGGDPQTADWANADVLTMDLADPDFALLSAAFSDVGLAAPVPTLLRIGGSYNDAVSYETPEEPCPPGSIRGARPTTPPAGGPTFCLTRARWAEINAYADAAGFQILFGVNFYAGRNSTPGGPHTGPANLTNLEHWLAMNAALAYPSLRGIELGNELNDVPAAVYGADVVRARALLDRAYAGSAAVKKPLLTGPAINFWDAGYLKTLFAIPSVVAALDVFTHHHYGPKATDNVTVGDAWSPHFLVQSALDAAAVRAETPLWTASGKPLWVSETALAWDSGRNGTSNTFSDGPWYITQLAGMAYHGVSAQARQTLRGGFYQLLSNDTGRVAPNPDWWTARVFKRAMGTRFFRTASSQPCCAPDTLFAYAACAPSGEGLTVAYVNPADAAVSVEVVDAAAPAAPFPAAPRAEWALSSGGPALNSTRVLLNGAELAYAAGALSPIEPRAVTDPSSPIVLAGRSYGFFTLKGASVPACRSATRAAA